MAPLVEGFERPEVLKRLVDLKLLPSLIRNPSIGRGSFSEGDEVLRADADSVAVSVCLVEGLTDAAEVIVDQAAVVDQFDPARSQVSGAGRRPFGQDCRLLRALLRRASDCDR